MSQAVQVNLILGHTAGWRKKPTQEGFTHDWTVIVRGEDGCDIRHFVEKVVFYLHESFAKPKRVVKEPPYQVSESGYGSFTLPVEVIFRNKEEPRKVMFEYDLLLPNLDDPPISPREARLAVKGEPNMTVMTTDIRPDIVISYNENSQTKSTYELVCPDGLSDTKESSNSSNSTLTTRTWFVNGNKHHVHGRVLTIRSSSDVLDIVGIYQCFVQNYTHEISRAYRLIAEDLPNPSANMVFNVLRNFSQFNLIYVSISWDIDKNPHVRRSQLYLRQSLEIKDDGGSCFFRLDGDKVSQLVMLQPHHLYKIRVVSGFNTKKCSEGYYYVFQWPNHTKGMVLKEDMFNCFRFGGPCRYRDVELVKNPHIAQPECKYNGDKLDCNFTWAANSSYEKELRVICPRQEDIVNGGEKYNPIRISVEHPIQCGSSCNLTINSKNQQSAQSIVEGFDFIKPQPPVVREAYWKYVNGYVGLSLDLNITDSQATCGSIQNCTLYGNEEILTSNLNCSALNLAENFSHFVWLSDYDRLHLKVVNISVSYTSVGGKSQRSNTIEVLPLIREFNMHLL